jgi:polyribonucleotide nucleotidyltransferase
MVNSKLDLVVAGTQDAVMMVESEAKELSRRHHAGRGDVRPQGNSSR